MVDIQTIKNALSMMGGVQPKFQVHTVLGCLKYERIKEKYERKYTDGTALSTFWKDLCKDIKKEYEKQETTPIRSATVAAKPLKPIQQFLEME